MATVAELINVAVHFTHYAIKNKLLVKPGILEKDKLLMLYIQYQKQTSNASRIDCSEIIKALKEACLIKSRKAKDYNCVEFKDQIFNGDDQVTMPSIPTIRITRNEEVDPAKVELLTCNICKISFHDIIQFKQHETCTIHQLRNQYRHNRKLFTKHVPFLEISDISNKILDVNQKKTFTINITNISHELLTVSFVNVYNLCDVKGIKTNYDRGCSIGNGFTFKFELIVNFDNYGAYLYPVVFEVCTSEASNKFIHFLIEPRFQVLTEEVSDLAPVAPYIPLKKTTVVQIEKLRIIEGVPPDNSKCLLSQKLPLFSHNIPNSLRKYLDLEFKVTNRRDLEDEVHLKQIRSLLCDKSVKKVTHNKDALNQQNYVDRFRHLMWIEEHQMDKDMHLYNQNGVTLIFDKKRNLFELKVPGLAEGRPSVLRGDKVLVKEYFGEIKFEGIVHVIEETSVFLGFNESFKKSNVWRKKLYVEFLLDRFTLRMCHRALAQIQQRRIPAFMFPTICSNINKKKKVNLKPTFNEAIRNNNEQMTAIKNIIENRSYPAPYILFGPPGTGKTATIVEAITQIWHLYKRCKKICVCAPSNSAADLITERLLKYNIPAYEIFRIYAPSRSEADIPEKLKVCSNYDRFIKEYFFPSREHIKLKSIVILTPMTAGRLVTGGFQGGHFDYLFMDEAGHCVEPEMIVPIIGLLTEERGTKPKTRCELQGNLILAGDPKQLGPVIRSTLAIHLGLDMSLMERLMVQCEIYEKDPSTLQYNPTYITKLVHNYRSHSAILLVPNMLFYDNELKVSGDQNNINCASHWIELPKDNFPLIFHGVKGLEDREGNSPSYFNRFEIQIIGDYLKKLVNCKLGRRLVKEQDIGIITPYRKQVQKLKQYLRNQNMSDISVASVEEFQGQERLIIIITTVRSRFEFVATDYQFGLGFLRNAKRFNVAITRAIALLIVIGNPDILQCDPHWRALIQYCIQNRSYLGDEPSGSLPPNFDLDSSMSMDLPLLTVNADKIPEEEKPGFRTDF